MKELIDQIKSNMDAFIKDADAQLLMGTRPQEHAQENQLLP